MKKIFLLLTILSLAAITNQLDAISFHGTVPISGIPPSDREKDSNNSGYDVREAARKFREKHGKPKINPLDLRDYKKYPQDRETESEYLERKARYYAELKNEILDSIEEHGHQAIISDTIERTETIHGWTWTPPLNSAIKANDLPFIKFLLQHGADPNQGSEKILFNGGPHSTTVYPIEYVHSPETAQYLKENGADLSPLFDYSFNHPFIKKHPTLRKYLDKEKAASNWSDIPRFIQPHISEGNSYNFRDDAYEFMGRHMNLLHRNAHYSSDYNPEDCNPEDRTAILTTYQTQARAILEKIYTDGHSAINTEVKSTHCTFLGFGCKTTSELPIVSAIKANDFPLIKFLLQHGANPNEPTKDSSYPIVYAKNIKMTQYLEDNGADLSPLFNDLDSSETKNIPDLRDLENKKTELNK